jgi:hypothetical protein
MTVLRRENSGVSGSNSDSDSGSDSGSGGNRGSGSDSVIYQQVIGS